MERLKAIATFVRCVELGSVSAAARDIGISQPTVSKAIAGLEAHLGGPLFVRSTRGLRLTAAGVRYAAHCKTVVQAVMQAEQAFAAHRADVSGPIRLAASPAFARTLLVPHLPAFLQRYPGASVDLRVDDRFVDLAEAHIDVAFRVAALKDSRLWQRGLGQAPRVLVAAPGYLAGRAAPRHPRELSEHQCIYFSDIGASRVWRFRRHDERCDVAIAGRFEANSSETVFHGARAGLGVALLPAWMVADELSGGGLVELLRPWHTRPAPVQAVSTMSERHNAKVAAVVAFFAERFRPIFGGRQGSRPGVFGA